MGDARTTPIDLGKEEHIVSIANMTKEERLRMNLYVETQHDGGNPSQLLELLAEAVETNIWERLTNGKGNFLSFFDFIERPYPDGIGLTLEDLKTIIQLKHRYEDKDNAKAKRMDAMRRRVKDLIHPEERQSGRPIRHNKADNIRNITSSGYGTQASYTLRRLKRDRPDLAEKVLDGEMSANAAAIIAGFREKRISIPLDLERAARIIRHHFDEEQVRELAALLTAA